MPGKICTFAIVAYFISCEPETLAQAVLERARFCKHTENTQQCFINLSLSWLINRACQKSVPFRSMASHLWLQHPTLHWFLGAHFKVLLVRFSEVPNAVPTDFCSVWEVYTPRASQKMFLTGAWIGRQTSPQPPLEIYLGQSFQTEVALFAVETSSPCKLCQLQ